MVILRIPLTIALLLIFASFAPAQTKIDNTLSDVSSLLNLNAPPMIVDGRATSGSDDFNRPDGTDMGPDWIEMFGDFWIGNNQGYAKSTGYMLHASVAAPYQGSTCSVDFFHNPNAPILLVYTALIAAAGSDFIFVKVQDNNSDGLYDRVFFYKNFNGGAWGPNPYYFELTTPTKSGRMTLRFDATGDVAFLDIDNNFDGIVDETFSCAGILSSGLSLGQGYGIATYHNQSPFDNWSANETGGSLVADTATLSQSTGGQINFKMDAGSANAGGKYILFGSLSGTSPGITPPNGSVTIPVNYDLFFDAVLYHSNTPNFQNFFGVLDKDGKSKAVIDTFGPFGCGSGETMSFAFGVGLTYWSFASNAVSIDIIP